jgi:hypothetical protein
MYGSHIHQNGIGSQGEVGRLLALLMKYSSFPKIEVQKNMHDSTIVS